MQVSCRATLVLIEALEAEGVRIDPLLAGLGVSRAHLSDPHATISWDTYATVLDRIAADRDEAALEALGMRALAQPGYAMLRRIARAFVSPAQIYAAGFRWFGPGLFTHLVIGADTLEDGRLHVRVELPASCRDSLPFFCMARGALRALPTLIGAPEAVIEGTTTKRALECVITAPPAKSLLARVLRAGRAVFGATAALRALEEQQEELKRSYDAILRGKLEFRLLLERIPDLVVIHRAGTIVWANRAFVSALGYARVEELLGRVLLGLVRPEARDEVLAEMSRVHPEDVPHTLGEYPLVRRDGGTVIVEVAPAQAVQFEGAPARLVVGRDVTDRKRMQEQLLLADRMSSLGVLAAGVAHEINNPLAYAYANLELLARELGPSGATPRAVEALATARDGLERVRAIVRDLKTFSRADDESLGPVDVCAALDSTLSLAAKAISGRARVVRRYERVPPARGNQARLGQVFLNLILNALDAIPEGAPQANELRLAVRSEGARVIVEVADTGSGIPSENVARVFDPFFTTKAVGLGTGLGLAICHGIVTSFGGEITVASKQGAGTTFTISLPVCEERRITTDPASHAAATRRSRLLVIDDEPNLLHTLKLALSGAHDVVMASSGRAAAELLRHDARFDLILCDLMMDDLTGIDLYDTIRTEHPELAERLVFMTGGTFNARGEAFRERVPNRFLEKPFALRELFDVIERSLRVDA